MSFLKSRKPRTTYIPKKIEFLDKTSFNSLLLATVVSVTQFCTNRCINRHAVTDEQLVILENDRANNSTFNRTVYDMLFRLILLEDALKT